LYIKDTNIMVVGGEVGRINIVDVYLALQCGGPLFFVTVGGKVGSIVEIV
jgi:hypothetical protein